MYHLTLSYYPRGVSNAEKLTQSEFIERAVKVHGNKYSYEQVEYNGGHTKVNIICPVHGVFKQTPSHHFNGQNCPRCTGKNKITSDIIEEFTQVHRDKYSYDLVEYINTKIKVKIICPEHGVFEQGINHHLNGCGCNLCGIGKSYSIYNIPVYDTYQPQLEPYGVECRRSSDDKNILEVKCVYCDRWHQPSRQDVQHKIGAINGREMGELNLYCTNNCKISCPTYRRRTITITTNTKPSTSREVQPQLRKLVLLRDDYTCQRCGSEDKQLHCHHIDPVKNNPIESADVDNCITFCVDCHKLAHKDKECTTSYLARC